MRINHASDDASGLVVSKKLQSQIMGAAVASRNAQDGISLLQTAEGGMRAISDMLLRMRELAVQAGNGTYTTSDRAELQKEMNQLKDEINRISGATEFNTKKLLNGNATALWSSSTDKVNLIINSNVRAGDYRLDISTAVGRSAQYSSHIMRIKGGEFAASVSGDKKNIAYVGTLEGQTFATKGDFYNVHVTDDSGIKDTYEQIITTALETFLISAVATYLKNEVSNDMKNIPGIKIGEFASAHHDSLNAFISAQATAAGIDANSIKSIAIDGIVGVLARLAGSGGNGNSLLTKVGDKSVNDYARELKADAANIPMFDTAGIKAAAKDTATALAASNAQEVSSYFAQGSTNNSVFTANAQNTTTTNLLRTGYLEIEIQAYKNPNAGGIQAISNVETIAWKFIDAATGEERTGTQKVNFAKGTANGDLNSIFGTITIPQIQNSNNFDVDFKLESGTAFAAGQAGISGNIALTSKTLVRVQGDTSGSNLADGGGVIVINSDGGEHSQIGGGTIAVKYDPGELTKKNNYDGLEDLSKVMVHFTTMDANTGKIDYAKLQFAFHETDNGATIPIDKAKVQIHEGGELATESTRLEQITNFDNPDGTSIFNSNQQHITIYANNGEQREIYLQGGMTLKDLDLALTKALVNMGLGADNDLAQSKQQQQEINSALVQFDSTTGTLQLRTALLGSSSTLAIVGSDEIVNAFGFDKSTKELNSVVSIITSDMRTGNIIAQETLASAYLSNSIQGATIEVRNAGVTATANNGNIAFQGGNTVAFIHLTDKSTNLQVGGNAGQQIGISIKQLDGAGLGINDAYVYSQKEAQIALSKIDSALTKMGSSRATVGAQVNRLQYTTVNLDTMRENLIFAHSRIVDADIAAETTLLIRNQVLRDAATAMLVQANMLPQSALTLIR